jgi:hypothetical protein
MLQARVNFINNLPARFLYKRQFEQLFSNYVWLCNILAQKNWQKMHAQNVDEIDT